MAQINQAGANDVVEPEEPATMHDVTEGGVIGLVGGAVAGAIVGGPVGALVGGLLAGAASAAAVDLVDRYDNDFVKTMDEEHAKAMEAKAVAVHDTYTGADYGGLPAGSALPVVVPTEFDDAFVNDTALVEEDIVTEPRQEMLKTAIP